MIEQTGSKRLTTLFRIGRYEGMLEEHIGDSSEGLKLTMSPSSEIRTFASFNAGSEPYFLMVSQNKSVNDLNCYIAVISYSYGKNKEVVERFKEDTGIILDQERKDLERIISRLEKHFPEFEKNPGEVISILGGV